MIGLLILLVLLFFGWPLPRNEVSVVEAELHPGETLRLTVNSCNRGAGLSLIRETDVEVQVKVVEPVIIPEPQWGEDCQNIVEFSLQEPLGDRVVIDLHTGRPVRVNRAN